MLLVLTATAAELRSALGCLQDVPVPSQGHTTDWIWSGRRLRLGVCGVGLVNAAFFLGGALRTAREGEKREDGISGVLGLGVCGSFSLEKLPLRTPCLTRWSVWPEFGRRGAGNWNKGDPEREPNARALGLPLAVTKGGQIWDRVNHRPLDAAQAMDLNVPEPWPWVTSLSVSAVGGVDRAQRSAQRFNGQTENMEGFAWAYGCALAGLPFLELRTVSNLAGAPPEDRNSWDLVGALEALGAAVKKLFVRTAQTPCELRGNSGL